MRTGAQYNSNSVTGTQSIRRAIDVLRQVAIYDRRGMRLVDISQVLALEKSTAHRILRCLVSENLLAQKHPGRRYVLGPLAYEIGVSASHRFPLSNVAHPHLQRIADLTGDVAFLSVRGGLEFVCIDKVAGAHPVKAHRLEIGVRRPLGLGAVGAAILSGMQDSRISEVLTRNETALARYGETSLSEALVAALAAKKRGYGLQERTDWGLRAIAVPIRSTSQGVIGALSIGSLASRLKGKRISELARMLKHEAKLIESELAGH